MWLVLALVLHWSIITSKNLYMVVAAFPLISELDAITNEEPKNSSYTWFGQFFAYWSVSVYEKLKLMPTDTDTDRLREKTCRFGGG